MATGRKVESAGEETTSNSFRPVATFIEYWPGVVVSLSIAFTALFLSSHYGGPVFLFALLVGISTNFIRKEETFLPGIDFASKTVLRAGVALLGLRIGVEEISTLNYYLIAVVLTAIPVTLLSGVLLARLLGYSNKLGILVGGATAICGASAALAIASVLSQYDKKHRDTLFTVLAVTALSTIAMAIYPLIASSFGLSDKIAGFFMGATIHDVGQVVGAGYSISREAGDIAVLTKLLRVSSLIPVTFILMYIYSADNQNKSAGQFPLFLIVFIALSALNSFHLIPPVVTSIGNDLSRFLLIVAVAAIGTKTYLGDLVEVGWKALFLAVATTVVLTVFVGVLLIPV